MYTSYSGVTHVPFQHLMSQLSSIDRHRSQLRLPTRVWKNGRTRCSSTRRIP